MLQFVQKIHFIDQTLLILQNKLFNFLPVPMKMKMADLVLFYPPNVLFYIGYRF